MKQYKYLIAIIIIISAISCRNDNIIEESKESENFNSDEYSDYSDWSESTHGNNVVPDYSVVFPQNKVLRFDIKLSAENWSVMQQDLIENVGNKPKEDGDQGGNITPAKTAFDPVWVPGSVFFNGKQWYNVGVRFKGNSSLQNAYRKGAKKFSFKLDFDEFEDDFPELKNQRFYGFRQLNLNNNYNDVSLMREKVAADLFREMGLISAKTSFCIVYLDCGNGPQYYGVYTLLEEMDDTVIETQLGYDSGNLYKPDGVAATFSAGTFNEEEMEKKSNEEEADYTDVRALYDIINSSKRSTNLEEWKKELESVFNVDVFMKWLATNTVMQNWDTYGKMTHNYYLYCIPETSQLNWIPWDNNESMKEGKQGGAFSLSLSEVTDKWPLIRYIIDVDEYRQIYISYMNKFVDEVFLPSKMRTTFNEYYNLIREYAVAEDPEYSFISSESDFINEVEYLKNHSEIRYNDVKNF